MVWILAMWENYDWDNLNVQIPALEAKLSRNPTGKWEKKAQEWIQAYQKEQWNYLNQLHTWWTLDHTLKRAIDNHHQAMETAGYDERQPDWARTRY